MKTRYFPLLLHQTWDFVQKAGIKADIRTIIPNQVSDFASV